MLCQKVKVVKESKESEEERSEDKQNEGAGDAAQKGVLTHQREKKKKITV